MMSLDGYLDAVLDLRAERGARTRCRITGNSMAPLIRHGDVLVIDPDCSRLRVGDVAVFRKGSSLVAHRVVHRTGDGPGARLLARGDASNSLDPPVAPEALIGRVVEVRGDRGSRRLTAPGWRLAGGAIARLVYASERVHAPDGHAAWPWRAGFALRRHLFPVRGSGIGALLELISRIPAMRGGRRPARRRQGDQDR